MKMRMMLLNDAVLAKAIPLYSDMTVTLFRADLLQKA